MIWHSCADSPYIEFSPLPFMPIGNLVFGLRESKIIKSQPIDFTFFLLFTNTFRIGNQHVPAKEPPV